MKLKRKGIIKFTLMLLMVVLLSAISFNDILGQCPMCRIAAESNLQHGGTEGRGLNTGILYMLSMPYLLVLIIGYIWYRNRKLSSTDPSEKI